MKYNKFIINSEIIFDMNSCEVKSVTIESSENIILNVPTARCLQLLLECQGRVVSREDFLLQVWNARGIVVSQNTFYQNISLLRKSLKKAGLSVEIIITVRRKGFTISTDTKIERFEEELDLPVINSQYSSTNPPSIADNTENKIGFRKNLGAPFNSLLEHVQPSSLKATYIPAWVKMILAALIIVDVMSFIINYF